ncbi:hypothetical protein CRG98_001162 [Punica granatum]|uniref:Uncharacterized protein n=1 Tax=Punica granatum TaxID=22663 RepID=A0A2I0LCP7_PUNGR|nr:hypothetical protein CRG98_001162 [Punica granatum]
MIHKLKKSTTRIELVKPRLERPKVSLLVPDRAFDVRVVVDGGPPAMSSMLSRNSNCGFLNLFSQEALPPEGEKERKVEKIGSFSSSWVKGEDRNRDEPVEEKMRELEMMALGDLDNVLAAGHGGGTPLLRTLVFETLSTSGLSTSF